jgi:hypothetical protein
MPTQFLSADSTLTRKAARYEVGMLADQITPSGSITDAFGRLRISTPHTLFDSQHRYVENDKWDTFTANGGTKTHIPIESAVNLTVTSTTDSEVIRESRRVMQYQPGKSLLIMSTFAMATPAVGLRQRIGYFGPTNGIFLENDGTHNYFVLRSASLATEFRVRQDAWNGDKFDSSGYSDRTIDVTKTQILWIDIEWLGVGDVRCGFVVNGKPVVAHTFHNDNVRTTAYMTTACLPLRYEIKNTNGSGGTMKQICSTVISEGGYDQITKQWAATRSTAIAATVVGTWVPVASIKLASTRLDSIVIPSQVHIVGTANNAIYEFGLIRNATITGGDWITHSASGGAVQYNVNSTSMSGGDIEDSGIFASSNQSSALINAELGYIFEQQLGRSIAGVSDTLTLSARALLTGGNVYGTLNWNSVV